MEILRIFCECVAIAGVCYWSYSNGKEIDIINRRVELLELENRRRCIKERKEI